MAIKQLRDKDLIVFLSSLKPEMNVRFRIINGDPTKFKFRINSIGTINVYPFSYDYNYWVQPKFLLEKDMDYHIYLEDYPKFNNWPEERQLKYLDSIEAFGVNIGRIPKHEDQALILKNCFHFDTFDTYVVEENKKYPVKFGNWLRPLKEADKVKASVQIQSIIDEIFTENIIIEVETNDKIDSIVEKNPYVDFIEKLEIAVKESNLFDWRENKGGSSGTYVVSIFCVKYRLNLLKLVFDLTSTPGSYRGSKNEYPQKNCIKISQKFREKHMDKQDTVTSDYFSSDVASAVSHLTNMIYNLKEHCNNEDKIICDELLDIVELTK